MYYLAVSLLFLYFLASFLPFFGREHNFNYIQLHIARMDLAYARGQRQHTSITTFNKY